MFTYDAAGNVINDGANAYAYDGEGRLCAVASLNQYGNPVLPGTQYVYDAEGNRVGKGTISTFPSTGATCAAPTAANGFTLTASYVRGLGGEQLSELDGSGNWTHTNVYAGGKLLATYDSNNPGAYFALADWLGTKRTEVGTNPPGCLSTYFSLPYGNAMAASGNCPDATEHHFTGKERDSESGNDYFEARYYGSSMGRMLSPDLLGGSLANPQSLNKYAYALNNPLVVTDPTGLYACKDDAKDATEHCTSDQDKSFEAARQRDLKLGGDAGRAAGAYGDPGAVNGVSVGFADLGKSGEDGKVVSSLGTDANGNLQAQSDVTINSKASGSALDAAVGHEGSHVADAQDVVKSIVVDPTTGNFTVGNNITRYQSEQRAYGVTNQILAAEGARANMGCDGCVLGQGTMQGQVPGVVNRIMNTGTLYMSGGQHMGPKNQGGSVVNGIQQTPNATVPH